MCGILLYNKVNTSIYFLNCLQEVIMNKRLLTLCLALALCLSLVPAAVFAGSPLKTYTELPSGVKAAYISMMNNGFASFRTMDGNGKLISKGVIAPNGNVPVFRTAKDDDPEMMGGSYAYAGSGNYIVDLQPAMITPKDGGNAREDYLIFSLDGKEVQYLTELIRYYDRLSADDYVYPHTVYFGNDGYLTAIVETNEGALNAYFIDFKDLTLKAKLGMDPLSPKADAPGTTITSLNDGLIAFSKYHGQWTGNDLDTIYDAAGWIDLNGNLKISIDSAKYSDWYNFASGRAMVASKTGLEFGYFDKSGKLVIPCNYLSASMFRDGYAYVCNTDGRYGYIDVDGNIAIPFQYEDACGYGAGLFSVGHAAQFDYKYGMVDKYNNEVVPCTYDDITRAYEDHAFAIKGGEIVTLFFKDDPEAAKDVKNIFTDVPDNAWYAGYLQKAYDNKIVGGTSADKYSPTAQLTHAQIMVMVAQLHSKQKGDNYDFAAHQKAGAAWYQTYEDYCVAEGIVPAETFTDPGLFKGQENKPVNRGQMAFYFAHTLTDDSYKDKQEATLSDIDGHVFAPEIERLAKANIVGGYSDGMFKPGNLVTRAEASVFLANILDAME